MLPTGRKLLINAGSNALSLCATMAVAFVLAPIVLRAIGAAQYGAWTFAESFVAYLTLFDLGLAAAVVRFAPRMLVQNQSLELNRLFSTCLMFFAIGAILALAIGTAFAMLVLNRFLLHSEYQAEFLGLFLILVGNFSVSLPLSVYPALLDATNQFTLKCLVRTTVLIARVPLTLAVISTENRLINLGWVIAGCALIENLALAIAAHRTIPGLCFKPSAINRDTVRQIASFSRDAAAAMFAGRLAFHTDAFVIGPVLGAAAITPFSFPARLVETSKSLLRSATMTLTATFSSLDGCGEQKQLRMTFLTASRIAAYVSLPVQLGLLLLGPAFLRLWIGNSIAQAGTPVLYALASVLSLTVAQSVASRVLYGTGRLRLFAVATLVDGISNLLLSLVLVRPCGITGVAIGTAIPHAVFCMVIIFYVCRCLGITGREYLRQLARPFGVAVAPSFVWLVGTRFEIATWPMLFLVGGAGLICHALVILAVERKLLWIKMRHDKQPTDLLPLRRAG